MPEDVPSHRQRGGLQKAPNKEWEYERMSTDRSSVAHFGD